jgi:hypothetical protein
MALLGYSLNWSLRNVIYENWQVKRIHWYTKLVNNLALAVCLMHTHTHTVTGGKPRWFTAGSQEYAGNCHITHQSCGAWSPEDARKLRATWMRKGSAVVRCQVTADKNYVSDIIFLQIQCLRKTESVVLLAPCMSRVVVNRIVIYIRQIFHTVVQTEGKTFGLLLISLHQLQRSGTAQSL